MNARYCALSSFALLLGLTFLPGCHNAPVEFAAPTAVFIHSDALPADVPAASPLFAATFLPAPVAALQVTRAPLPPEPTDPDAVAKQAVQPVALPPASVGLSAKDATIPADVGLLVCDPVASASSPALNDFGDGYGP